MRKADYKKKYKKLVRTGNLDKAKELLNRYRYTGSWDGKADVKKEKSIKKKVKKKVSKKKEIDDLIEINGIGEETLKDIKRIYPTIDKLKDALKNNLVPLRNDQVIKLKNHLEV